jgi:hypothetical protein
MGKNNKNYFDKSTPVEDEEYYLHKKHGLVRLNPRQFIACMKRCCIGEPAGY